MKRVVSIAHLAILATIGGAAGVVAVSAAVQAATGQGRQGLTAQVLDVQGKEVGKLTVAGADGGFQRVSVQVWGLPAGFHGFHIHATGKCDPGAVDPNTGKVSPFFTAGPHLDLGGTHGHGAHAGDLPNLLIGQDGRGTSETVTDRFRAEDLLDADGSAIVVHALADNHGNIPERYESGGKKGPDADTLKAGDSGGRTACGVIADHKN
ncbi:superoxide dismutase family protein [Actinomadura syzygii]|uniref:Superoxide dismutase [Cu-Zn] n=1 Tax=Actinomadura syzygii TaxID=1427538 RepID=A0A5D0TY42_9ACTN|nr:superoxide dismutase family protein [Actinomadura syzygii]TYC10296.1 superoxide dismutase [Actinomadura syzygii]